MLQGSCITPSRPFTELTNIVSAGMIWSLAVPATWSQTVAPANRVLLDGGDIPVAPIALYHIIEVMGPNTNEVYEALGTAVFVLDPIFVFIILRAQTLVAYTLVHLIILHILLAFLPSESCRVIFRGFRSTTSRLLLLNWIEADL
ncbi:hypothetical protein N7463_003230 [Penicillium fimorum]|uniref:Uncharacterized protein n=1 Tax=Penicillium fimorum TaxID=1882269 RepID=A0A9X0C928_9EURO|nr:hypothetical protein N7463_003230 [Penicillium fimorum]